jgi:ELWxxDGT repeat protein
LTNQNGLALFAANDGSNGNELWRSNGQFPGTVLVKDINPGGGNSNPANFFNHASTLFFAADDGTSGTELWKSDAFTPGTVLVADINPGAGSSSPAFLSAAVTTLFFAANDGSSGIELWTLSNPIPPAPLLRASGKASFDTNLASLDSNDPHGAPMPERVQPSLAPRASFERAAIARTDMRWDGRWLSLGYLRGGQTRTIGALTRNDLLTDALHVRSISLAEATDVAESLTKKLIEIQSGDVRPFALRS